MSKYIMLDLFSGLGGASQAMVDHPDWTVIRVDNNEALKEHCPDTHFMDIQELAGNLKLFEGYLSKCDLIWASPPCTDFSDGYNSPKTTWSRENPGEEYKPDMSLLEATIKIIEAVKPTHWIIENVRGAQPFFQRKLGEVRKIIGPYYLWGDFPLFHANLPTGYSKENDEDKYGRALRSNARALVPWQISEACRQSIQYQTSIEDWHHRRASL